MPDPIDIQLVRLLGRNALQNSETLAKQLNISSATVRRKLKKLIKSGLLHIVGVVDPAMFGLQFNAIIALDVQQDKLKSVAELLLKKPETTWIATTTGRFDIMFRGRFASTEDFSKFLTDELAMMDGVTNSETFVCLNTIKGREIGFP